MVSFDHRTPSDNDPCDLWYCSFRAIDPLHPFAKKMMDRPVDLHEDRGEFPPCSSAHRSHHDCDKSDETPDQQGLTNYMSTLISEIHALLNTARQVWERR